MARVRSPLVTLDGVTYRRIPIATHRVTEADDIVEVVDRYSREVRRPDDILFVSEKVTAVTQGRAIPVSSIKPGRLARLLWRRVRRTTSGVGLRSPETMQCAIDEAGAPRILLAAVVGGATRLLGRSGDFYRIAGMQATAIDAAWTSPLQPDRVILGPRDPAGVARRISDRTGVAAAIVDVNDVGGSSVLGSHGVPDPRLVERILRDNPLGQKSEQTPFGLIRVHTGPLDEVESLPAAAGATAGHEATVGGRLSAGEDDRWKHGGDVATRGYDPDQPMIVHVNDGAPMFRRIGEAAYASVSEPPSLERDWLGTSEDGEFTLVNAGGGVDKGTAWVRTADTRDLRPKPPRALEGQRTAR